MSPPGRALPKDWLSQVEADVNSLSMVNHIPEDSRKWQAAIETVIKSVVSIHFSRTRPFDTDGLASSQATGFVVDAEKGYILTNRHVVSPGPFTGYCVFDNHEEVSSSPLSLPYA